MTRKILPSEKLFLGLLGLILLFMLFHDWIPLGSLNDLDAVHAYYTTGELVGVTLFNVISVLVVLLIASYFAGRRYPLWAKGWLIIHLCIILYGALRAWWIPYFFGADPETVEINQFMFGSVHSFLPKLNGITISTLHLFFHLALLITIALSVRIAFIRR